MISVYFMGLRGTYGFGAEFYRQRREDKKNIFGFSMGFVDIKANMYKLNLI